MSRHRASRSNPATAWRPRAGGAGGGPWAGLLTGFGVLVMILAVLAYLISAQPGKAPGSRLVEPARSATGPPTSPGLPARSGRASGSGGASGSGRASGSGLALGSASTRPLPAPVLDRAARPSRLRLPSIGVDSTLQPLGLLPDGSLQSPANPQQAGWYAGGTVPGDIGPAVIDGDRGSAAEPAVFRRLPELRSGDPVLITRQDGTVLRFLVDGVQPYGDRAFPSRTVYGPVVTPELRLLTNGLVVSAHLA